MKTLMYPIAPDDDFPEMFCAIRQGSGEHWFYAPEGESASWILFRAETENAKLRELVRDMWHELNYASVRAENGTNHCLDHMAAFDARMEDLRIEVDA